MMEQEGCRGYHRDKRVQQGTSLIQDRRTRRVPVDGQSAFAERALGITDLHNRGILFAALYELVVCELCIFVSVHISEYLVHSLQT